MQEMMADKGRAQKIKECLMKDEVRRKVIEGKHDGQSDRVAGPGLENRCQQ